MANKNAEAVAPQKKAEPESVMFIWPDGSIRHRQLTVKQATDRVHMHGLATEKQGQYIEVVYGIYETSDKDEIEYLRKHRHFNGPESSSSSFREATEEERFFIQKMMNGGVQRKAVVPNIMELKNKFKILGLTRNDLEPDKLMHLIDQEG